MYQYDQALVRERVAPFHSDLEHCAAPAWAPCGCSFMFIHTNQAAREPMR
jgi:hypothetical protein